MQIHLHMLTSSRQKLLPRVLMSLCQFCNFHTAQGEQLQDLCFREIIPSVSVECSQLYVGKVLDIVIQYAYTACLGAVQ